MKKVLFFAFFIINSVIYGQSNIDTVNCINNNMIDDVWNPGPGYTFNDYYHKWVICPSQPNATVSIKILNANIVYCDSLNIYVNNTLVKTFSNTIYVSPQDSFWYASPNDCIEVIFKAMNDTNHLGGYNCGPANQAGFRIEYNCNVKSLGDEEIDEIKTNIYPNPFTESINITSNKENFDISLFDINGKLIFHANNVNNNYTLNLSFLKPAIYFIRIENSIYKIIKSD